MTIFKNKHVVAALLIAPVLSLISYFAVDAAVSEKPHAAKEGASYKLVEKSNCRYGSGKCQLKNGEFELTIHPSENNKRNELFINAEHPLNSIIVSIVDEKSLSSDPIKMKPLNDTHTDWKAELPQSIEQQQIIRLVASTNNSHYFGEANLAFLRYETAFQKDFR